VPFELGGTGSGQTPEVILLSEFLDLRGTRFGQESLHVLPISGSRSGKLSRRTGKIFPAGKFLSR
jgi:hypothetical protein